MAEKNNQIPDDDFGLDFIQFQENRREEKQSDKQKNKKD